MRIIIAIMLVLTLALAAWTTVPLHSMLYHEARRLSTIGNNTLLAVEFTVKDIGNYGYASIYLTYNGVYAYGLIILKAPGKNTEIYVMAGDQNHWHGPVRDARIGEDITAYILILKNKTLLYNIGGKTGKYDLVYLPPLTTLHLVMGNITGRTSTAPKIIFKKIVVYVTNSSLPGREIRATLSHGIPPKSMIVALNISFIPMTTTTSTVTPTPTIAPPPKLNTTTTQSTTTSSSPRQEWLGQQFLAVLATIIVISAITVFLLRKKIITTRNE